MASASHSQTEPDTGPLPPVTSIVLPTYNEAQNVPRIQSELDSVLESRDMRPYRPVEIIYVDGGSTDGTKQLLATYATEKPRVRFVHLRRKFGQSAALAAGFDHATGDYVVPMDADGQNDPRDIPRLLDELASNPYGCVSGWRQDRNDPWQKTLPSAIQTRLATRTGPDIHDFGCTLKAYRRDALGEIDLYGEGHRYIPAKLHKHGYSVSELPVNHRPREHGESRYGAGRLVRGFVDLIFHWFWYRYSTRPLHALGVAAFACMTAGGLMGGQLVIQKYLFGASLRPHTPRLILTALLVITGLQLFVFGVLAEMQTKQYYRGDAEYRVQELVGFD